MTHSINEWLAMISLDESFQLDNIDLFLVRLLIFFYIMTDWLSFIAEERVTT